MREKRQIVDQHIHAIDLVADNAAELFPEILLAVSFRQQLRENLDRDERVLQLVRQPERQPHEEFSVGRLALVSEFKFLLRQIFH